MATVAEPGRDGLGTGDGLLKVARVSCAEDESQRAIGHGADQPTANCRVAEVEGPGQVQRRRSQIVEAVPGRVLGPCAHRSQALGQTGGGVGGSGVNVGIRSRERGEDRLGEPTIQELAEIALFEAVGQALVGTSARRALQGALDAGGGSDQNEVLEVWWPPQRRRQRHSTPHGVSEKAERLISGQIEDALGGVVDRASSLGGSAVPRQIDRQDGVMFTELRSESSPGGGVLCEAVAQDQQRAGAPRGRGERGHQR